MREHPGQARWRACRTGGLADTPSRPDPAARVTLEPVDSRSLPPRDMASTRSASPRSAIVLATFSSRSNTLADQPKRDAARSSTRQASVVGCAERLMFSPSSSALRRGRPSAARAMLPLACVPHPRGDRCRTLTLGEAAEGVHLHGRDFHHQVDSLHERAGQALPIPIDLHGRAAAAPGRVARVAARARVHRRDELEGGGEFGGSHRPGDPDPCLLPGVGAAPR